MEALHSRIGGSFVSRRSKFVNIKEFADLTHEFSIELLRPVRHDSKWRTEATNYLLNDNPGNCQLLCWEPETPQPIW